ncbi:hypothetical protein GCM10011611_25420 [Aliidongia dinghuensis]|uniref:Filamentous haemagglutinin FhaB/tRNA nuclease CdiA-like TPS domain-containing protein n=1 Tax=Aliidongia dinghuensis TaxID=1867774 RepID=A0A8J2YUZ2_9PROT|nr:filamentous haemagglutinin family protein [Aliidongia dinghuensis]GGF18423.1 hypothetical protein GCM10011611_25420 [Aliidongia dinghuensis]
MSSYRTSNLEARLVPRHVLRTALLASVSALTLLTTGAPAEARNVLAIGGGASSATASAAVAAVTSAQQAAAATQQSMNTLARAAEAIQAMQAAQSAARNLALQAPSAVPDGLAPGGLQVAPGAVPGSALWQNANAPTESASNGHTTVDIRQTAPQAILNWQTFNVSKGTTVQFDQQGNAGWAVLNRVTDPGANPSQLLGTIVAPGTVLIMNHNGIIFGGGAQVNVGALVAATLDLTDAQFLKGIVNPKPYDDLHQKPFDPVFANTSGGTAGDVTVMPGAEIQTAAPSSVTTGGGFVYLFGSNVTNGGVIMTPDGQTVLAGGDAVYISQSTDPNVRGVEINLGNGGKVTNAANGLVSAPTGNVMLVGHAIEQDGLLLASTSIDEAGSISLLAHDGIDVQNVNFPVVHYVLPARTGSVILAPGSLTAVLPQEDGRTALDAQPQSQSAIKIEGASISVLGGATVLAPSGQVTLRAALDPVALYDQDNPSDPSARYLLSAVQPSQDAAPIYLADGAVIDVAGLQNVPVAASDDVVQVTVRGNELRDSPLQRGGILNSTNVWVNIHDLNRVASDQIYTAGGLLEVSGWLGLIPRTIDERLTTGGSVTIQAGQAILRPGASINIAGGSLAHQAGLVNDTLLVGADGLLYDVNSAPADMMYTGIAGRFVVDHSRWGVSETYIAPLFGGQIYQAAYTEGKSAGSLTVNGRLGTELDADVYADAVNGVYQRSAGSMAHNGSLLIGPSSIGNFIVGGQNVLIAPSFAAPDDPFAGGPASVGQNGAANPQPSDDETILRLSADKLNQAHYGSITVIGGVAGGTVVDPGTGKTLPSGISLVDGATLKAADGGAISLQSGGTITIDGRLVAHAGSVTLTSPNLVPSALPPQGAALAVLAPGSTIDVTGLWTNDLLDPTSTAPALYDGGAVTLDAVGVQVGQGALIDASGGGWLQANGKLKTDSHGLPLGTGGDITIITNSGEPGGNRTGPATYPGVLVLDGTLRSNGLHGGGTLTLAAPAIQVGGADPADGQTLWLDPGFFSQGGFGQYSLIAYNHLTVAPGTDIELHARTLIPNGALLQTATGADIEGVVSLGAPPLFQQAAPVNLVLSADDVFSGDLVLGAGSQINGDPGASVSLHASDQLTIDGGISAPGGTINLDLASLNVSGYGYPVPAYNPARTLWIGADAQFLAPGLVQTFTDASGFPAFRLWNGGSVNINEHGSDARYYPYGAANFFGTAISNPSSTLMNIGPTGSVVGLAGSVIDVSGVAGEVRAAAGTGFARTFPTTPVATDAGSLTINGGQGLFLDTTLLAHAGGPSAAGGSLTLEQSLYVAQSFGGGNGYATPVGELILSQSAQSVVPAGLKPGDALPANLQGQMYASADQIIGAGFDAVSLSAVDAVVFNGNVNLHVARSLTLNTGAISATPGAHIHLSSTYVDIGNGRLNTLAAHQGGYLYGSSPVSPLAGTAELTVDAGLIDFEGSINSGSTYTYTPTGSPPSVTVNLPGFADMNFNSTGDIRLASSFFNVNSGQIATLGNITFTSAQIYPITSAPSSGVVGNAPQNGLTVISATGPTSAITIARNGDAAPPPPLAAGGQVQFIAPTINQGGVLRAPMGQITFGDPNNPGTATTINLLPGSITSVSANGLVIPYGGPLGDAQYIYGYNGYVNGTSQPAPVTIASPLQKQISFYGQSVTVAGAAGGQAAAKIDESGGGDLFGFQFVSGTGGSVDVLNGVNTFAILPSLGLAYAPRSPLMESSSATNPSAPPVNLKVGEQVYLSGYAGLPVGYYTLLPGHYALLPGAYELTVSTTGLAPAQIAPNLQLPTGSYLVSGYGATANTQVRDALGSEYIVTPNAVVRREAQYNETTLTQFFQAEAAKAGVAPPRLPIDAGQLVLDALTSIDFAGEGDFSISTGGRGGLADIVGNQIEVLGPGDSLTAGFTSINDSFISRVGAQSILIGGVRTITQATNSTAQGSLTISQEATDVEIGSHAVLSAPEVMLRATSSIVLDPGAVIDTTGASAIPDTFPADPKTGLSSGTINLSGGAFLLASNAPLTVPIALTGSGPSSLSIGAGARVDAGGSLALANQSNFSLDPTASFGAPSITIAAPILNIGGAGPSGIDLSNALLSALIRGDAAHGIAPTRLVTLSGGLAINVYGAAQLGGVDSSTGMPTLAKLALNTPSIQGFGAAGDAASITAAQLTLTGGTAAPAPTGTGQGSLSLNATELTLGAGNMGFGGFSNVALNAGAQLIGSGTGVYSTTGDLLVSAPLVTGAAGADTTLNATGAVVFGPSLTPLAAPLTQVQSLGAHLTVNAASITQGADISLPSGVINLNGASGVTLAAGSTTDVSGAVTPFFDVVRIAPAGTVNLQSQAGDVDIAAGATVNLSGGDLAALDRTAHPDVDTAASDQGGDGGALNIVATVGTARLDGVLKTATVSGYNGAQASLDLGSGDASALLAALQGFSGRQALTLETGDIAVANLTARDVELSAATGNLTVSGRIDASGPDGGTIRLAAGNSVTVEGSASLDAHASTADGNPGSVFLGIGGQSTGRLTLASGSSIDVTGSDGGRVWLRAPRLGADGVAITADGVTVTGAREIDAEAVAVTDISGNPFVDQNLANADAAAQAYIANAPAIKAGIGSLAGNPLFHLMPGIEFDSTGDLTLLQSPSSTNTGIDLHTYRYDGEPMVLTLRAAGNINMNGSLSDGFNGPVSSPDGNIFAVAQILPQGSRSATLRLTAGADLASADPDALLPAAALPAGEGSIVFNDPHNDQYGFPIPSVLRTGMGDLDLSAAGDVNLVTPFGIYTAGTPSSAVANFTPPTRQFITSTSGFINTYLGGFDPTFSGSGPSYDESYPTALYPTYPEKGGNLTVKVRGNLSSSPVLAPTVDFVGYAGSEPVVDWLWTMASSGSSYGAVQNGTAFINFGTYYQDYGGPSFFSGDVPPGVAAFVGLGALGGGNVDVRVGGNLSNVDVVSPATLRAPTTATSINDVVVTGGGDLSLTVGGVLGQSNIVVGHGVGVVRAAEIGTPSADVRLMVGDGQVTSISDRDANLQIGDPTRATNQSGIGIANGVFGTFPIGLEGVDPYSIYNFAIPFPYGFFTSYTENTAFNVLALGGDVRLDGDYVPPIMNIVADTGSIGSSATLTASSTATGNVGFNGGNRLFVAFPAPTAQVDLLAGKDISYTGVSLTGIEPMSSANAFQYNYAATIFTFQDLVNSTQPSNIVQPDDPRTDHVYALGSLDYVTLATAKRAEVRAGLDILSPVFEIQNNHSTDVSLVQAGRDIVSCGPLTSSGACLGFNIRVAGPGALEVEAGRDITIEALVLSGSLVPTESEGISSIGNLDNALLPATGASISVGVGLGKKGPDIADFIAAYFDPANAGGVLQNYAGTLLAYMQARESNPGLSITQALADFRALPSQDQLPLVEQVYFAEVKAGGRVAAAGQGAGGKGYDRAYKAIETLFPGSTPGTPTTAYQGDLSVFQLGRIRTEAGGDIDILAPGGGVSLGIESQTPDLTGDADTARPGLLTLRQGDVNIFTDQSVIVAQSRVFTELGGDILMFSDNGDLNAGKGKQTSITTAPAQFTVSPYGQVTKSPVTPQTGAGIATLIGVPGVKPGDVDLFAPHGTIDAGDAGIRVSGDLHIAALQILNAANIAVQGVATGLPTSVAPNTGALTAASNTAGAATAMAESAASQSRNRSPVQDLPSIITVEVIGYGGDRTPVQDQQQEKYKVRKQQSYSQTSPLQVIGLGPLNDEQQAKLTKEERGRLEGQTQAE